MNGHSWTPDRRADLARREAERRATTPRLEVEAHQIGTYDHETLD